MLTRFLVLILGALTPPPTMLTPVVYMPLNKSPLINMSNIVTHNKIEIKVTKVKKTNEKIK